MKVWNQQTQCVLVSSLLVLMTGQAWAADVFPLERVEFLTDRNQTDIILHTGSIVPYHKVLVSENKLIIDIDQVSAEQTVRTNFSGAPNVSHVVIQPLSEKKLRLIVRGEHLNEPTLAFRGNAAQAGNKAASKLQRSAADWMIDEELSEEGKSLSEAEEALISQTRAALDQKAEQSTIPAVHAGTIGNAAHLEDDIYAAVDDEGSILFPATMPEEQEISNNTGAEITKEPISQADLPERPDFFAIVLQWLKGLDWVTVLSYGTAGGLLLGFGLFIRSRLAALRKSANQFDTLLDQQQQGKRVSFREMASAYKQDKTLQESKTFAERPRSAAGAPIGLSSLKSQPIADVPTMTEPLRVPQPEPRRSAPLPAPKKQVVNQYLKQQPPRSPAHQKMAGQKMTDSLLRQELQRAKEVQTQASSLNKPAAKPAPRKPEAGLPNFSKANASRPKAPKNMPNNGPLPGNPEVVNFLRNVAELMEKDGKPHIAQSIQKNLRTT